MVEINKMDAEEKKAYVAEVLGKTTFRDGRAEFIELVEASGNDRLIELLPVYVKAERSGGGGGRGETRADKFKAYMLEKKEATPMEIFMEFEMGNHEVTADSHKLRTKVDNPEDIVWIQRDGDKVILKGVGPEKPADWKERKSRTGSANEDNPLVD